MCSYENNYESLRNCWKAPKGCISDHTGRKTVVNFDLNRVKVYVGKYYLLLSKFRGYGRSENQLRIHQMVSPISNSESTICFNWQTEKKPVMDQEEVCFLL